MEPHTRLPVARPIDASMLMPKGLSDAEYLAAFKSAFDNQPVFTDVTGDTLLINDDFFRAIDGTGKVQKRGREQFIKLIARAIQSPDEIWMLEGFHVALQKNMLRRRYIARFLVDGDPKPVLAVLELDGKTWTGVTGYQAEADSYDAAMLVNARIGERVYARVK